MTERNTRLIEEAEDYLKENFDFRLNVVTGRCEFRTLETTVSPTGVLERVNGNGSFEAISEYDENCIIRELAKCGLKIGRYTLRNILLSDFSERYDPFVDYLNKVTPWDGRDYIYQLACTVKTSEESFWQDCFKRWFVAMVGSLLNENVVNHTVLVLAGKQGLGKTTWLEKLVPYELKKYMYSGTLNLNNKDTDIHLSECMLINLDELENCNKNQIGTLKEKITKSGIRMRRAYGRHNESLTRRASFTASVNNKQFLHDTTGNRRFLSFEVDEIQYTHDEDLSRVYSQAMHLFKTGFKYWFDKDDIAKLNRNNEQFEQVSVVEEALLQNYEPISEPFGNEARFYSTTQLAEVLFNRPPNDSMIQRLGKALNKHEFKRVKQKGVYVYALKKHEIKG